MITPYHTPRQIIKYKWKPLKPTHYQVCVENNGNFSVDDKYIVVDDYRYLESARKERKRQETLHPHDNFVIFGRI